MMWLTEVFPDPAVPITLLKNISDSEEKTCTAAVTYKIMVSFSFKSFPDTSLDRIVSKNRRIFIGEN